jgi:hypothetical protein
MTSSSAARILAAAPAALNPEPAAAPVPRFPVRAPLPRKNVRRAERRALYIGEGLTVTLRADGTTLEGEAIDLTPEGIGVAVSSGEVALEVGDVVTVEHTGRGPRGRSQRAVVKHLSEGVFGGRRVPRIGLAFLREKTSPGTRDRRAAERYACAETFPIQATALSPLFFGDWLLFRVKEVSGGGATLATTHQAPGLLAGVELSLTIMLPMGGSFVVRATVCSVYRDGDDGNLQVGVAWLAPPSAFLNALAEHLLFTSKDLTPTRLRKGGLKLSNVERALTYDYARRAEDYQDILSLRLRAHQAEGRLLEQTTAHMAASFDEHARHLTCRFGQRLVGYVRVIYVDGDPSKSQYVSAGGHDVPEWLWEAGFVEAGAGAIDPEFQRAGLFLPLMQHAVRVALQSGHRYMLGACSDDLLDMYLQMGFTHLETRMVEPKAGWSFRSHLIVLDMEALLAGESAGKFVDAMASAATFARAV